MTEFSNEYDLHSNVYILNLCQIYNINDYETYKELTAERLQ